MTMEIVQIELDEQSARRFARTSKVEREKLRLLLTVWLRELEDSSQSLGDLMDEISDNATSRGVTPEIVESLLGGE